jgi:hypothetical protein
MVQPPHHKQPTCDLHRHRDERATHPPQERVHNLEHGKGLHDSCAPADDIICRRCPAYERHECIRDVLLEAHGVSEELERRELARRRAAVEQVCARADEDIQPAGGGDEVVRDEVCFEERRRACVEVEERVFVRVSDTRCSVGVCAYLADASRATVLVSPGSLRSWPSLKSTQ